MGRFEAETICAVTAVSLRAEGLYPAICPGLADSDKTGRDPHTRLTGCDPARTITLSAGYKTANIFLDKH